MIYLKFVEVEGVNGARVLGVVVEDGRVALDQLGGIVDHDVATVCPAHNHTTVQIGCFHAFAAPYDLVESKTKQITSFLIHYINEGKKTYFKYIFLD